MPEKAGDVSQSAIEQIVAKIKEAQQMGFAEIVLVIEKGRLRWIRGPAPSEPINNSE